MYRVVLSVMIIVFELYKSILAILHAQCSTRSSLNKVRVVRVDMSTKYFKVSKQLQHVHVHVSQDPM